MIEVPIKIYVNEDELMSAVFDNINRYSSPWIDEFSYSYTKKDREVLVRFNEPYGVEDEYTGRKTVTVDDLTKAWATCITSGNAPVDLDDWDSNYADNVLQQALFGEIVYG
jgi:hypothetical protein